jgi:RimJ/RimL family protein N-acetyltransferase
MGRRMRACKSSNLGKHDRYFGRVDMDGPVLRDDVVVLRPLVNSDLRSLVEALQDPGISRWIPDIPYPYTNADGQTFLRIAQQGWASGRSAQFAITDAHSEQFLGTIGAGKGDSDDAAADIGYWIAAQYRRRGIATRALVLASRWCLTDWELIRLQLNADVRNEASLKVATRAGFHREGTLRSIVQHAQRIDVAFFSLLSSD